MELASPPYTSPAGESTYLITHVFSSLLCFLFSRFSCFSSFLIIIFHFLLGFAHCLVSLVTCGAVCFIQLGLETQVFTSMALIRTYADSRSHFHILGECTTIASVMIHTPTIVGLFYFSLGYSSAPYSLLSLYSARFYRLPVDERAVGMLNNFTQ